MSKCEYVYKSQSIIYTPTSKQINGWITNQTYFRIHSILPAQLPCDGMLLYLIKIVN